MKYLPGVNFIERTAQTIRPKFSEAFCSIKVWSKCIAKYHWKTPNFKNLRNQPLGLEFFDPFSGHEWAKSWTVQLKDNFR